MFKKTAKKAESVQTNGKSNKTESKQTTVTSPSGHIVHSSSTSSYFEETKTEWKTNKSVSITGTSSVGPALGKKAPFSSLFSSSDSLTDLGRMNIASPSSNVFKSPERLQIDANPFTPRIPPYRSPPQKPSTTRPINLNYQPLHPSRSIQLPITTASTSSSSSTVKQRPVSSFATLTPTRNPGNTVQLNKKLAIAVKKATKFSDSSCKVPTYITHSKNRGKLLLINNIKFICDKHLRKGAEVDEENLVELFKQMDFEIVKWRNLSKNEMEKKIKLFAASNSLKKVDVGVVIIMSHGTGNDRSDSTHVIGTDGQLIESAWIVTQFNSDNCPYLEGKPKILVFQCCRGDQYDLMQRMPQVQHDAIPFTTRKFSDLLIAYSTAPGFISHRNPEYGTWYIQALCTVFMENAYNTHVEDMLKMVDNLLADKSVRNGLGQTGSFENRGFKNCYLHPKFYG